MKLKTKVLFTIIILGFIPFLMGQQGCDLESPLRPPALIEETKQIPNIGAEIIFSYDGNDLAKITVKHFNEGVKGKATIILTNEKGDVLQTLYQNLFFDLISNIRNIGRVKKGMAEKGNLVGIELQFKCLNPLANCLKPDDFSGTYVLGSGQEIQKIVQNKP